MLGPFVRPLSSNNHSSPFTGTGTRAKTFIDNELASDEPTPSDTLQVIL